MEAILIAQVQADGDHLAFEKLMKMHQSPVRLFLRRLTQLDYAIADELAQETFLKAYQHISSYRNEGKFLSWLFQIAYRHFVSYQRKKKEISNTELIETADEVDKNVQYEASRTVEYLMKYLSQDERAALLLHFGHEMSHAEIVNVMSIPLGTVKSLIRRAKIKLRDIYEKSNQIQEVSNG